MHDVFSGFQRKLSLISLVGSGAGANRNLVGRSAEALKIAHQHSHQVSRKFLRGCELEGVLVFGGPWGIRNELLVGNSRIALVHNQRDIERCLLVGLIETRKSTASVGGLELGNRVAAFRGFTQIEAAQLAVQDSGEHDVQTSRACGNRSRSDDVCLFAIVIGRDFGI